VPGWRRRVSGYRPESAAGWAELGGIARHVIVLGDMVAAVALGRVAVGAVAEIHVGVGAFGDAADAAAVAGRRAGEGRRGTELGRFEFCAKSA